LIGTQSLMALRGPSCHTRRRQPHLFEKAGEGCELSEGEIIAELAHYAFWVELARAATDAIPEKANAPTV